MKKILALFLFVASFVTIQSQTPYDTVNVRDPQNFVEMTTVDTAYFQLIGRKANLNRRMSLTTLKNWILAGVDGIDTVYWSGDTLNILQGLTLWQAVADDNSGLFDAANDGDTTEVSSVVLGQDFAVDMDGNDWLFDGLVEDDTTSRIMTLRGDGSLAYRWLDSLLNGYTTGSGTPGTLPIWTGANALGNSSLTESGGNVIGTSFTGAFGLATGTDAQRPVGANGLMRYNSTGNGVEAWNGSAAAWRYLPWASVASFTSGSVLFADASGRVSQDNSNFSYASDKLYLGTTSLLDIRPVSGANNTAVSIGTVDTQVGIAYIAIGWSAESDHNYGIAIGHNSRASEKGVSLGVSNYANSFSVSIGEDASANGISSIAILGSTSQGGSISIGKSSSATALYSTAVGHNAGVSAYGTAIGRNTTVSHAGSIAIGNGARTSATNQFVAGSAELPGSNGEYYSITDVYFGSGVQGGTKVAATTNAAGVSYTIHGSGAGGTNNAGGNITIAGGKGTGTGTPGDVIFSTSDAGASGSTLQTLAQRVWVKGETGQLSVGTASPNASALVQVESTTQGFLPPRMTTAERDAIASPAAGLVIFNTTTTKLECYDGATWQAAW